MSPAARALIERFNRIMQPDGGSLEMIGVDAGVLRVRYTPARHDHACECCKLDPGDLRALIQAALEYQDRSIRQVDLLVQP